MDAFKIAFEAGRKLAENAEWMEFERSVHSFSSISCWYQPLIRTDMETLSNWKGVNIVFEADEQAQWLLSTGMGTSNQVLSAESGFHRIKAESASNEPRALILATSPPQERRADVRQMTDVVSRPIASHFRCIL